MINRRKLVNGALVAGAATLAGAASTGAADQQTGMDDTRMARAVDDLRKLMEDELDPSRGVVAQIRAQQRTFILANQKFPDFIDVGLGVWERAHDWHIKYRQPLTVTRMSDGRYGMAFMFTTLVLRPEQTNSYVSYAYDLR
jgi:hypothetical protein